MADKSWENVKEWYDGIVGEEGHYYHKNVIMPFVIKTLEVMKARSVLDIACGQGVLSRHLDDDISYCGVDLSPALVTAAMDRNKKKSHRFYCGDARKVSDAIPDSALFDCATVVLAIQDIDDMGAVFKSAYRRLSDGGRLLIVMNHPCFRIPRQSGWGFDEKAQVRYRTLNMYMTPSKIPIKTHPGKEDCSLKVNHYHRPLHMYFHELLRAGFVVEDISELISDKTSTGKYKNAEDRARKEFPLFLALQARKLEASR